MLSVKTVQNGEPILALIEYTLLWETVNKQIDKLIVVISTMEKK